MEVSIVRSRSQNYMGVFQHYVSTLLSYDLVVASITHMEWESLTAQICSIAMLARLSLSSSLQLITRLCLLHCDANQYTFANSTRVALLLLLQGFCLVDISSSSSSTVTTVSAYPFQFDLTPGPCKSLLLECVDEREQDVVTHGVTAALRWAEIVSASLLGGGPREAPLHACTDVGALYNSPPSSRLLETLVIQNIECLVWFLTTWVHCYISPRGLVPRCHDTYKYREGTQASQNVAFSVLHHLLTFLLWWPRLQLRNSQQGHGERLARLATRALLCLLSRPVFVNIARQWGGWGQYLQCIQNAHSELPSFLAPLPTQFGGSECQILQFDILAALVRGLHLCTPSHTTSMLLELSGQWVRRAEAGGQTQWWCGLALCVVRGCAHPELMEKPRSDCLYFFLENVSRSRSRWLVGQLANTLSACCECLQGGFCTWPRIEQVYDWNGHLLRALNETETKTSEEDDECLEYVIALHRVLWKCTTASEQKDKISSNSAGRRCLLSLLNIWPHIRQNILESVAHRNTFSSVVSQFYQLVNTACTGHASLDEEDSSENELEDVQKANLWFECKISLDRGVLDSSSLLPFIHETIQIVLHPTKASLQGMRSLLLAALRAVLIACLHCHLTSTSFASSAIAVMETIVRQRQQPLDSELADLLAVVLLLNESNELWTQEVANRLQVNPSLLAALLAILSADPLSARTLHNFRSALIKCFSVA